MKKLFLITALYAAAALPGMAQPSWRVSKGIPLSPPNVKMICRAWKLDSVEMFDVTHTTNAKEKGDCISFNTDGAFSITMEGAFGSGTWKAGGVYINTVSKQGGASAADTKMMFKAISVAADKLILDYQTPDLITVRYTYTPKE